MRFSFEQRPRTMERDKKWKDRRTMLGIKERVFRGTPAFFPLSMLQNPFVCTIELDNHTTMPRSTRGKQVTTRDKCQPFARHMNCPNAVHASEHQASLTLECRYPPKPLISNPQNAQNAANLSLINTEKKIRNVTRTERVSRMWNAKFQKMHLPE
jgi:hypothetical protein